MDPFPTSASTDSPLLTKQNTKPDRKKTHCLPHEKMIVVQALPAPSNEFSRCNNGHLRESQTSGVRRSNNAKVASSDAVRRPRGRPRKFSPSNVGRPHGKTSGRPRGRPRKEILLHTTNLRKFGPSKYRNPTTLDIVESSGHASIHEIMMVPFSDDVSDARPFTGPQLGGIGDFLAGVQIKKGRRTTVYRAKKNDSFQGVAVAEAPPRSPLNQLEQKILKNVDKYILSRVRESVDVVVNAHMALKSSSLKAAILKLEEVASMDLNTLLPPLSETLDLNYPPGNV